MGTHEAELLERLILRVNHVGNVRLPVFVVLPAEPAVIAGVGGNAVKAEFILRGINFVQETMQRKNAGSFRFVEDLPGR